MKRLLLALTFIFLSLPALAQAINPPSWATGYINVAGGTTVTTNITNSPTAPNNLNITAGGAITTWNVRMPFPTFDGQLITIACPYGNVTTLNVTAVAPDTVQSGGPSSCTTVPGQAVQYQYFRTLAQWAVLATGTSAGGLGTMGSVTLSAGTNITLSGSCNSITSINCTINTPASMGSVAVVAGTNITLSGTCTGTASINCTVNGAAAPTASATGGLTATANVFSLGGDSGNIVYTSPGQLQLGKSGTAGTLAIGNATSGLLTLKAAAGALGANSITFPATGGVIAADAFLGVGSGLNSTAGLLGFGDTHVAYQLGAATWVAADNTLGSGGLRYGWSFTYNSNYSTTNTNGFDDDIAINVADNNNVGQNTYGTHLRAKAFFAGILANQTNIAAGQRIGISNSVLCYGMGDCGAQAQLVQYGGAPIAGDEGQDFSASQILRQQNTLTKAQITVFPLQTLCNTTLTTSVNGSSTAQPVGVADTTNCLIGNWVVINVIPPDNSAYTEAVKITGVGAGPCPGVNCTITGAFFNDWTLGAIVNPFTSLVQGTCPGGGSTCDGTYSAKPLTGGSGTGGTATVTVVAGVASISINAQGDNYQVGDVVSVAPANMGGITGFSATVGTICCGPWTVTPATVMTVSSANQWGEQRVVVNKNPALAYSTGQASGGVIGTTGAFTGIGTTWNSPTGPLTGGTVPNPGCITLTADDYSGSTINNGTFTIPLQNWYEIASVTNNTSLAIYKTTVANDGSYSGNGQYATFTGAIAATTLTVTGGSVSGVIGPGTVLQGAGITAGTTIVSGSGLVWIVSASQTVASEAMTASHNTNVGLGTGAYTIAPCARILKLVGSQIILDNNAFTWTVGDSVEQIIAPYPDTHGIQYIQEAYTWGGTYRSLINTDNQGGRTLQTAIILASHMQTGGGADTVAYSTGVEIDNAAVGITMDSRTSVAMNISNPTAPVCWVNTGGVCFGPNATLGAGNRLLINFAGGGAVTTAGLSEGLWGYAAFATNGNNPINNPLSTLEYGGNFMVSAIGHANNETTVALAHTIGFDSRTPAPFEKFMFANTDGIAESSTAQKMLIYSTNGLQLYGDTAGTDPTGSNSSLGTVTIFQGGSEAELGLTNAALTQNVTLTVSGAGVLTVLGNGSGSSNGGIIVGAETVNSFTGVGSRPVCVTSTGVLEVGSLSAGLVTCP